MPWRWLLAFLATTASAQDSVPRAQYDSLARANDSLTALVETARAETLAFANLWVHEHAAVTRQERHWGGGTLVASNFDSYGAIVSRDLPRKFKLPLRASVAWVHDNEADTSQILLGLLVIF